MRFASWNVNSIKARLEHVLDYCKANKADVLLLQELKITDENFPRQSFEDIGWQVATHGQKTYNPSKSYKLGYLTTIMMRKQDI